MDGSGEIDLDELQTVLSDQHGKKRAVRLFVIIDSSNTGLITRDTWREWFMSVAEKCGTQIAEVELRYMERATRERPQFEAEVDSDASDDEAAVGAVMERKSMGREVGLGSGEALGQMVRALFTGVDVDGSGDIDREELSAAYGEDSALLFDTIDSDGSGDIDMGEWMQYWTQTLPVREGQAALRDHLVLSLEENVARRAAVERKQRRMYYATAKERGLTGRGARFSHGPGGRR